MFLGVAILIITGLCWTFTGVVLSYTTRRNTSIMQLGLQGFFSIAMSITVVPDYRALGAASLSEILPLAAVLLSAGVINGSGVLTLQRAMRTGHHGVSWAVGQSALVLPFLAGAAVFHEPVPALRLMGLASILASMALFARKSNHDKVTSGSSTDVKTGRLIEPWMLLAIASLMILGTGQTMMTVPTYLNWSDSAHIRMPLFIVGNSLVYLLLWIRRLDIPNATEICLAVAGSAAGVTSIWLLFKGLDLLRQAQMTSVGYPIAICSCILAFTGYSGLILREKFTRWHVAAICCGLGGIVCISLN